MGLWTVGAGSPEQIEDYIEMYDFESRQNGLVLPEGTIGPSLPREFSPYRSLTGESMPFTITRNIKGSAEKIVAGEIYTLDYSAPSQTNLQGSFVGGTSVEVRSLPWQLSTRAVDHQVVLGVEADTVVDDDLERQLCLSAISIGLHRVANGLEIPAAEKTLLEGYEQGVARFNTAYASSLERFTAGEINGREFLRQVMQLGKTE